MRDPQLHATGRWIVKPLLVVVLGVAASFLSPARAEEADAWPPKGPGREGRTLVFPTIGLRWTLPEGSPFSWASPIRDETKADGVMVRAEIAGDAASPRVVFRVDPATEPLRIDLALPPSWVASLGEDLTNVDTKRTELKHPVAMGNGSCHYVRKWGTWKGKPAVHRSWLGYRHGRILAVEAWCPSPEAGGASLNAAVDALVATMEFDGRKPWVIGPAHVAGTLASDRRASSDAGKETDVPFLDRTIKKPVELSSVPLDGGTLSDTLRGAWEAWSPDRTAYFCAVLEARRFDDLKGDYADDVLRDHEKYWKENVPGAEVVKKGKLVGSKVPFGKAKGLGYEFRGRFCDVPFVQRGFFFVHKGILHMLHFQYGGEGAEEQLGSLREKVRVALGL